jgi:hypothetical protein
MKVNKFDSFNREFSIGDYVIADSNVYYININIYNPGFKELKDFLSKTPGVLLSIISNGFIIKYYNIPNKIKSHFDKDSCIFIANKPIRHATKKEIKYLEMSIDANKYNL